MKRIGLLFVILRGICFPDYAYAVRPDLTALPGDTVVLAVQLSDVDLLSLDLEKFFRTSEGMKVSWKERWELRIAQKKLIKRAKKGKLEGLDLIGGNEAELSIVRGKLIAYLSTGDGLLTTLFAPLATVLIVVGLALGIVKKKKLRMDKELEKLAINQPPENESKTKKLEPDERVITGCLIVGILLLLILIAIASLFSDL